MRLPTCFAACCLMAAWTLGGLAVLLCGLMAGSSLAADARSADPETDSRLDTLFGSHEPYATFLTTLKAAAAQQDWATMGDLVAYPLKVTIGRQHVTLNTAAQFKARAPKIMTAKVLRAIKEQTYVGLFANAQGAMIGDGEMWFSGICSSTDCKNAPVKITAIKP